MIYTSIACCVLVGSTLLGDQATLLGRLRSCLFCWIDANDGESFSGLIDGIPALEAVFRDFVGHLKQIPDDILARGWQTGVV